MKKHAIFADRLMMNFMNVWIVGKLYATTVQCKLANIVSVKIASNDFVVWGMCVSAAMTVFSWSKTLFSFSDVVGTPLLRQTK